MTIKEVIDYVNRIKKNEFTDEEKTRWINEIEGYVQIQIMLLAQPECISYCHSSESEQRGVCFPSDGQMRLPRKISAHVGGLLTIEGLVTYEENNLSELEIQSISENGKVIGFAEGTFKQTGTTPESAIAQLQFDGQGTELLVPTPFDRLYYEYVLAKISENLEESSAQNNRLATFDETWQNFAEWYANTYRPADGKAAFKGYYITGKQGAPGSVGPPGKNAYNISISTSSSGVSANKTYDEIMEQLAAGVLIIPVVDGQSFNANTTVSGGKIIFTAAEDCGKPMLKGYSVNANSEWAALSESLSTEAQTSDKYTKPVNGIPKDDLASGVQASLGKADTALQSVPSTYRTAVAQDVIDGNKQDKLIAGDNITIAADGRTISAAGGSAENAVEYFEVVITENDDGTLTGDKTFEQVKAAIDAGKLYLKATLADEPPRIFSLVEVFTTEILFGTDYTSDAYMFLGVMQSDSWAFQLEPRVAYSDIKELSDRIGSKYALKTTDKTSTVAAINEVFDSIPKKTSQLENDSEFITSQAIAGKVDTDALAPVATSGSYSDLTDKPDIPSVPTATISANTAARHTHDNKTVLDAITYALKTAWSAASSWVTTNGADVLAHLTNTVKHITAAERTEWNAKQDKIIAGNNITIGADGKTISATGGGGGISGDNIETVEAAQIELPSKLSELKNDTGFITADDIAGKQDTITDLATIRIGAEKGATALQSVPSTYRTASAQDAIDNTKVDKVTGKGLSTNDYTAAAKAKVDAIPSSPKYTDTVYDDTAVKNRLSAAEKTESITLSVASSRLTGLSYTAKYYALLGAVFVRVYGTVSAEMNTGYDYDVLNIGSRLPEANAALAVKCSKNAMAFAKSTGVISVRPLESGIKGYDIYIAGFWFV